jgi:hypothetical protein
MRIHLMPRFSMTHDADVARSAGGRHRAHAPRRSIQPSSTVKSASCYLSVKTRRRTRNYAGIADLVRLKNEDADRDRYRSPT